MTKVLRKGESQRVTANKNSKIKKLEIASRTKEIYFVTSEEAHNKAAELKKEGFNTEVFRTHNIREKEYYVSFYSAENN